MDSSNENKHSIDQHHRTTSRQRTHHQHQCGLCDHGQDQSKRLKLLNNKDSQHCHRPNKSDPLPTGSPMKVIQSPYYLCTVTCCESENCIQEDHHPNSSSTVIMNQLLMNNGNNLYEPYKTIQSPMIRSTNVSPTISTSNNKNPSPTIFLNNELNTPASMDHECQFCRSSNQNNNPKNLRILWADSLVPSNVDESITNKNRYDVDNFISDNDNEQKSTPVATNTFKNKHKLKLKSLMNNQPEMNSGNNHLIHSPEMSSSPMGNNSSNTTEYTEIYTPTPMCGSANSANQPNTNHPQSIIQPLFKINHLNDKRHRNSSTTTNSQLDYRLYFMNDADKHGFFRKAVPTLPLAIAVMFCIMNLILPGSGTFLAAVAIIFGSQTEYGPGCGYQAFLICFLSSILQFATAILVFGWVWSIMWGIVFIKNSLRYGQKRDIHTISLC